MAKFLQMDADRWDIISAKKNISQMTLKIGHLADSVLLPIYFRNEPVFPAGRCRDRAGRYAGVGGRFG